MHSGFMAEISEMRSRIGAALRASRRARGLTQEALAAEVECSVEALSNAERGLSLPSLDLFFALARVLGLDIAALIDGPKPRGKISKERMRLQSEAGQLAIDLEDKALLRWVAVGRIFEQE